MYHNIKNQKIVPKKITVVLLLILLLITSIIIFLYQLVNQVIIKQLRNNLIDIAYLGSLYIAPDNLLQIKNKGDIYKEEFKNTSKELNKIKKVNSDIRYVYLMRKTNDVNYLSFIIDADNYLTVKDPDLNNNNKIDPNEYLSLPGDLYDISNTPHILKAFDYPNADHKILADQWGKWLSGYAPIKDTKGETIAIIGVDMSAEDVDKALQKTLRLAGGAIILTLIITSAFYLMIASKQKEILITQETDKLKSTFLTEISHELRTPIVAIVGFAELIQEKEKKLSKDTLEYLALIQNYCNKLIRKVNHIIDFAKIKSHKTCISQSTFKIEELFQEIISSLEPLIKEKNIKLNSHFENTNIPIQTDKDKIYDILNNLLGNSIKFTGSGGKITVDIKQGESELVFVVGDSGIGIPKENLEHIFDDFTQITTNKTIRKYKGSGLGLFIVKGLVGILGGEISVESKLNQGTTFTVKIPITKTLI